MRLRELFNVTILNQTEVKYNELLVVLFGNPFIDAMESKKEKKYYLRVRKYFSFIQLTFNCFYMIKAFYYQKICSLVIN